jgi:hypothetical protein
MLGYRKPNRRRAIQQHLEPGRSAETPRTLPQATSSGDRIHKGLMEKGGGGRERESTLPQAKPTRGCIQESCTSPIAVNRIRYRVAVVAVNIRVGYIHVHVQRDAFNGVYDIGGDGKRVDTRSRNARMSMLLDCMHDSLMLASSHSNRHGIYYGFQRWPQS